MAATVTIDWQTELPETTQKLYGISVSFVGDTSYPTGGEVLDVAGNERFERVICQLHAGYGFEFDAAAQKLKVYYGDYSNASDGVLIEVPDTTNLSALTGIKGIAVGS